MVITDQQKRSWNLFLIAAFLQCNHRAGEIVSHYRLWQKMQRSFFFAEAGDASCIEWNYFSCPNLQGPLLLLLTKEKTGNEGGRGFPQQTNRH
jgi:hypothetical protein